MNYETIFMDILIFYGVFTFAWIFYLLREVTKRND